MLVVTTKDLIQKYETSSQIESQVIRKVAGWVEQDHVSRSFDTFTVSFVPDYFNKLALQIIEINRANGWDVATPESWEDTNKIPAVISLIHSGVSEALEAFRHDDKENFVEELGDIIIRVLDLTAGMGLDIDKAVADKLEKNKTRGYRHGGKRV